MACWRWRVILKHMMSVMLLSVALLGAEPALAGGPNARSVEVEVERTVIMRSCTDLYGIRSCRRAHDRDVENTAMSGFDNAQGLQTVTLSDGFFQARLSGGVERPIAIPYGYNGRRVVIIGSGHTPQSAGQAAAARGLPRG